MEWAKSAVLITGASRGIGRALAIHFARKGAHLLLMGRSPDGLRETAARIEDAGGYCDSFLADLRDPESLDEMILQISNRPGRVDVLINNAADVTSKPFLQTTQEEIDSLIRTNVIGALQLTRLVVPLMIAAKGGVIVNMSSLAGFKPNPAQTVYSISKSAVNGMSDALRAELAGKGIHVINAGLSSVSTGAVTGPGQAPVERLATALDRAIDRREDEIFLSPLSRWLMRLYRFYPPLAKGR